MAKKNHDISMAHEMSLLIQEGQQLLKSAGSTDKKQLKKNKKPENRVDKPLAETTRTKAVWLDLFNSTDIDYSYTLELDEIIPSYCYARIERSKEGQIQPLKRYFTHRGRFFSLEVIPAKLKTLDKDGNEVYLEFLPGEKEEIIYDIVKKIAAEGRAELIDGRAGLVFSYKEVQNILYKYGHSASIEEIKKSLTILRRTNRIVTDNVGNNVDENIITYLGQSKVGRDKTAYIVFNSYATESLRAGSYRLINIAQILKYESTLARKLHKFISHNYSGIDTSSPYVFRLIGFMQNAGFSIHKKISRTSYYVDAALDELKKEEIVKEYKKEPVNDGNKCIDMKYTVWANHKLVRDVIKANRTQKETIKALDQYQDIDERK